MTFLKEHNVSIDTSRPDIHLYTSQKNALTTYYRFVEESEKFVVFEENDFDLPYATVPIWKWPKAIKSFKRFAEDCFISMGAPLQSRIDSLYEIRRLRDVGPIFDTVGRILTAIAELLLWASLNLVSDGKVKIPIWKWPAVVSQLVKFYNSVKK